MPILEKVEYETYCQGIASGMKIYDAYRSAYPSVKRNVSARTNARRLERERPEILERIKELREKNAESIGWSREKSLKHFVGIADNIKASNRDRIAAGMHLDEVTGILSKHDIKDKSQLPSVNIFLNTKGK